MIRRVFSRQTYNGYHLVHFSGEGSDPTPLGFVKKTSEKDECGFIADTDDMPQCQHPGQMRWSPWDNWLYVPSDCQSCIWVYRTRDNNYDCLLKTREKINPHALQRGGP
ncbi:hypothetical protein ES703_96251 [subsurface metagenome]